MASGQRPAASGQRPAASGQRPAASGLTCARRTTTGSFGSPPRKTDPHPACRRFGGSGLTAVALAVVAALALAGCGGGSSTLSGPPPVEPAQPPVHVVGLPDMHDLSGWLTANPAGTVSVPAGEHRDAGGVRFSCPAGGADCAVTVTVEDGTVAVTSTDGMASAMPVPPPVHVVGLPDMHDLSGWLTANPAGTVSVPAGEHRDAGGVRFSCPAGGTDCAVTVTVEDGTVAVTSTDGMATSMPVPPQDRLENIHETANTLLRLSRHLRYVFNWTGLGQSTSDHVVDSFSCTGSRCVGSNGEVSTLEDFTNPDNLTQLTVSGGDWETQGGFVTIATAVDVDLSTVFFAETTLTEYPSYDIYGIWGQYGALNLQVVDGPMAGQIEEGNLFTGDLGYAVAFVLGNATGTNPQGTGSATWSGVAEAVSISTFQRGQGTATLTIADLSQPRVGVDINIPGFAIGSPGWSDIPLTDGRFATGTVGTDRLEGDFHGPSHYEAWGVFDTDDYVGGFGAKRTQ